MVGIMRWRPPLAGRLAGWVGGQAGAVVDVGAVRLLKFCEAGSAEVCVDVKGKAPPRTSHLAGEQARSQDFVWIETAKTGLSRVARSKAGWQEGRCDQVICHLPVQKRRREGKERGTVAGW